MNGGTIIVDEVQNVGGSVTKVSQYQKILSNLASEYRIGLSATGYRVDGLTNCLYALMNKVKYRIEEDAIQDKIIKAEIIPIYTNYEIPEDCMKWDGTLNYTKLPTYMAENVERNNLILKLLKENKKNYCLILSDRLEGLRQLHEQLNDGLMIDGSMTSKKAKQEREEAIQKLRNKEEHFLFASFSLARERVGYKTS